MKKDKYLDPQELELKKSYDKGHSDGCVQGGVIVTIVSFAALFVIGMMVHLGSFNKGIKAGGLKAVDNPKWAEGLRLEREGKQKQWDAEFHPHQKSSGAASGQSD